MNKDIKEIYLSGLEWTKTHDNIGGVMGNLVFKHNISYEEYQKILKNTYFVLCNKDYITNLQNKIKDLEDTIIDKHECIEAQNDTINNLQTIEQQYSAILSENAELQNKLNQYENPDDLTLFYMWLDEKAKDKMKQLENEIIMLKQQNQMVAKLGDDYKSRNEKAIEIIEKYGKDKQLEEDYLMNRVNLANYNCLLLDILKGKNNG